MTIALFFFVSALVLVAIVCVIYMREKRNYQNAEDLLKEAESKMFQQYGYGVFKLFDETGAERTYIVDHNAHHVVTTVSYVDDSSHKIRAYITAKNLFDYNDTSEGPLMSYGVYDQIRELLEPFSEIECAR